MKMRDIINLLEASVDGLRDGSATNIQTLNDLDPIFSDEDARLRAFHHPEGIRDPDDTYDALSRYTELSGRFTRGLIAGGLKKGKTTGFDARDVAQLRSVHSFIERAPPLDRDLTVYSSLGFDPEGDTFTSPAFLSTTIDPKRAAAHANDKRRFKRADGDLIARFHLPVGYTGGRYLGRYSKYRGEAEFLLGRNQTFEIVGRETVELDDGGSPFVRTIIDMRPILPTLVKEDVSITIGDYEISTMYDDPDDNAEPRYGDTVAYHTDPRKAGEHAGRLAWYVEDGEVHIVSIEVEGTVLLLSVRMIDQMRGFLNLPIDPGMMNASGKRLWAIYQRRRLSERADQPLTGKDWTEEVNTFNPYPELFTLVPPGEEWRNGACEGDLVYDDGRFEAVCTFGVQDADELLIHLCKNKHGARDGSGRRALQKLRSHFTHIVANGVEDDSEAEKFWRAMGGEGLIDELRQYTKSTTIF